MKKILWVGMLLVIAAFLFVLWPRVEKVDYGYEYHFRLKRSFDNIVTNFIPYVVNRASTQIIKFHCNMHTGSRHSMNSGGGPYDEYQKCYLPMVDFGNPCKDSSSCMGYCLPDERTLDSMVEITHGDTFRIEDRFSCASECTGTCSLFHKEGPGWGESYIVDGIIIDNPGITEGW